MRAIVLSHHYADPSERRKLKELATLGWAVVAAVPGGTAAADGPVQIVPIPLSGRRWSRRAIRRLFRDVRPNLVAIEEEPATPAAAAGAAEAARLGIPSVVFSWESLPRSRPLMARRRYERTLGLASGVIGGNRLARALLNAAAGDVPSISLPRAGVVPPARVERLPHDGLTLAYVGRLVPERGPDRLLRACGQLMGPWTLTVAGTGPEQEALEGLAERLGLAARLRWLGSQSRQQITDLWPRTDCLVVPSRSTPDWVEAWSPVLVDAMAHGVAAVVSDAGVLPEIVGDGEAGAVFTTDEELLVELQSLVSDPARRRTLGEAARRRILDRYLDAGLARATDAFWREVLRRGSAPAAGSAAQ